MFTNIYKLIVFTLYANSAQYRDPYSQWSAHSGHPSQIPFQLHLTAQSSTVFGQKSWQFQIIVLHSGHPAHKSFHLQVILQSFSREQKGKQVSDAVVVFLVVVSTIVFAGVAAVHANMRLLLTLLRERALAFNWFLQHVILPCILTTHVSNIQGTRHKTHSICTWFASFVIMGLHKDFGNSWFFSHPALT